jgi:hypothetical protein
VGRVEAEEPGSAPEEDIVSEEEAAAAEEAGAIGGEGGADDVPDEAARPVYEGGGGEAEGFELAERDLIDNASGDLDAPDPLQAAGRPEAERSGAEYGEPDEVESTEVEDDTAGPEGG